MNTKELRFLVFCIENVADRLGLQGNEVYSGGRANRIRIIIWLLGSNSLDQKY